jgi:hypothetical protein
MKQDLLPFGIQTDVVDVAMLLKKSGDAIKSFESHAFMLIIIEVSCSKFQPIAFNYSFSSKYIKTSL